MTPSFNHHSCEVDGCGFITVDDKELEDHKQFHGKDHVHGWSYKHEHGKWVCGCGKMCEFFCIYCNEPLAREEIPKEAFKKISSLVYFHNDCLNEGLKK